jgi:hypothetical protein
MEPLILHFICFSSFSDLAIILSILANRFFIGSIFINQNFDVMGALLHWHHYFINYFNHF